MNFCIIRNRGKLELTHLGQHYWDGQPDNNLKKPGCVFLACYVRQKII